MEPITVCRHIGDKHSDVGDQLGIGSGGRLQSSHCLDFREPPLKAKLPPRYSPADPPSAEKSRAQYQNFRHRRQPQDS